MRAKGLLFALLALLALAWPGAARADLAAVAETLLNRGEAAVAAYDPADGLATSDVFSDLYFDVFEAQGLEAAIGRRDGARKADLESRFSTVIGIAARNGEASALLAAWIDLRRGLAEERDHYAGDVPDEGLWAPFVQAFLILLREGVEALLVVGALIAYVQRVGAREQLPGLYAGIGSALVASGLTAWAVRASVLGLDGRALEAVEGVTMLIAAGILLYVGHWLLSKRDAERWQGYIRSQVDRAVASGSGLALSATAFLAVYREGAETVLFYQALMADRPDAGGAVAGGFIVAAVVLAGLFVAVRALGLSLPLKQFFTATAVLLVGLAFVFVGKGIVELQVIRWLPVTPVDAVPTVGWLGVFPTAESLLAQGLFLVLAGTLTILPKARRLPA